MISLPPSSCGGPVEQEHKEKAYIRWLPRVLRKVYTYGNRRRRGRRRGRRGRRRRRRGSRRRRRRRRHHRNHYLDGQYPLTYII